MNHLTLKLIKEHLNLDNDFTMDDEYLSILGDVVEKVVERHIDDSFAYLANTNGGHLPAPLIQAMLLLLGTYYANREHIAFNANYEVGNSYTFLIDLYRNYSASHSDSTNYTLINSIDELMKKNKELNDKVENIKTENSEHLSTISTSIQNLKEKVDKNEYEIGRINGDMSSLMSMVNTHEGQLSQFEATRGEVEVLKSDVNELKEKTIESTDSVEVTVDGVTTKLDVNEINGGKF
ncbi:head-tail connector protein [Prevotella histicola]|uniref:head-tail connector protein n=1 Tax=Prevotella histicola TaxID=470565 RepID=UPI0028E39E7F|nr:head-tail connector protein [Prevotella histicola]